MTDGNRRPYFAYGSNLLAAQMQRRCPECRPIGRAVLADHRFLINARGVATVVPAPGEVVEGFLWSVTGDDEARLDRFEGVAAGHYLKRVMPVQALWDDCTGEAVEALAYVATESSGGIPRPNYIEILLRGARECKLSKDYIRGLCNNCSVWHP